MSRAALAAILLCAASAASAQTAAAPVAKPAQPQVVTQPEEVRFGLQIGFGFPNTKTFKYFSDKGTALVVGAQMTWDIRLDRRLRARVDFTKFPDATVNSLSSIKKSEGNTITGVSGGIDYIWFTQAQKKGKPEGFYVTGGLALAQWNQDTDTTGNTKDSSLGLAAGLGWQFNKTFGMEARGTWSRWETNIEPRTIHNAGTVNLEASFRF